jgi:hypothetical protein
MNEILSNPKALIALLCVVALIVGVNAMLLSALRGRSFQQYAAKWSQAFSGGAEARKRQREQLDELHRRVEDLNSKKPTDDRQDA